MEPTFFPTPEEFRKWLEAHHETEQELVVGYYRKKSGLPSMTWEQSVDEALCFGWIDGIRRGRDEVSYTIRFTPRKPTSTWSAINLRKVEELTEAGRMKPAGIAAWENRTKSKMHGYSYNDFDRPFSPEVEAQFKRHKEAWQFYGAQPPSYRKQVRYWIMNAKREETREKRLQNLIEHCERGARLGTSPKPDQAD